LATVDGCNFDAMDESIGKYWDILGMGFELFMHRKIGPLRPIR
jgi:hypothetical protein